MLERKAFSFDPNRCTGCQACELACSIENSLDGMSWRQVSTFNPARRPEAPMIHLSMACNHCADAPCMEHCPALAYTQDAESGIVTLHADRCIGCRYCSWACPYDAPKFDAAGGVMTKCTFCSHRQADGLEPACVVQCPTGALGFGDLEELAGDDAMVGVPTTEPDPSIRFTPWNGRQPAPACGAGESPPPPAAGPAKISLRSEWPLAVFTLIMAALAAAVTASAAGAVALPLPAFLAAAVAAMALSTLHLGRKLRAWRAMLNLRRSWLSREIALTTAFVGLAGLHLLMPELQSLAVAAALAGFAALFAMDRVYDLVLRHEPYRAHSADVMLTGLLASAVLLESAPAAVLVAAVKLGLYLARKLRFARRSWPARPAVSALRVGFGFALPLALGLADPAHWPAWALAGTAVGELIDRAELYTELRVPSPAAHMAAALDRTAATPKTPSPAPWSGSAPSARRSGSTR